MENLKQSLSSVIIEGSMLNDYTSYVSSISLKNQRNEVLFNSLFTLTKIFELKEDMKTSVLKNAYVMHDFIDFYLGFELIYNFNPKTKIYASEKGAEWIKNNTPEYLSDAFKNQLSNLSDLTKDPESNSNYELTVEDKIVEIIGLDEQTKKITLVWIPKIESLFVGVNLLRNLKKTFD